MKYVSYRSFRESIFSFFKSDPKNGQKIKKSLVGKIVAIDTKHKSSDNFNLVHIYEITDNIGKIGKFLGNIKYKNRFSFFKKSIGKVIIEKIENWRELSSDEYRSYESHNSK